MSLLALHALSREVTLAALKGAITATPRLDVALALALTAASFAALSTSDVIAMRAAAPGAMPDWLAGLTGAAGQAVSNALGFTLLTGVALRLRVYRARGLDAAAVGGVLAFAWASFWMAVATAAGAALLLDPSGPAARLGAPPAIDRGLGAALLVAVAALLALAGSEGRTLRVRGVALRLPSRVQALALMAVSLIDVGASSLALWVLLPAGIEVGPAAFFVAYVAAVVVGIVSHAPGGIGAFEATLIAALGLGGRPDVLAALVLYRLIYDLLPFAVTALGLAALWWRGHRGAARGRAAAVAQGIAPLVPPLAAGVALLAGTVLLFSGALPALRPRAQALELVAPLALVEGSHLVGSALGVVLLVLARGLLRRQARAWGLAMGALGSGALASLLKGLDWEEAGLMALAMTALAAFRPAFDRRDEGPLRLTWSWGLGAALLIGASIWLGLLAYRRVDDASDLWWRVAWSADAPRFLRASVAAAVALAALGAASLLRPRAPRDAPEPIPEAVRRLVRASRDTEANIALLGDKRFLVSPRQDAFLMYRRTRVAMIAKSDPFGDPEAGEALAWALHERADRAGLIPAFYAIGTAFLPTYLDMELSVLKIGEIARVPLPGFSLDGHSRKGLRHARSRAAREGLSFEIVPASAVPALMDELRAVSDAWLARHRGEEKSFALGRFDPAYLSNHPHAVMRDADGRVRAFANLWLGAEREELSLDLMRHDPEAPGVVMNALFAELTLWGKAEGYAWFNLGAVPLAGLSHHPLASHWNRLGAFVYEHGEGLYGFEGLRAFKEKFDPVWSPNYLACPGGLAAARVLIEVNRLISGGARGLLR